MYLKKYTYIVLFAICFLSAPIVYSQTNRGTDFWIGFMEHIDKNSNTKVLMLTSDKNTSGTISVPLQSWSTNFTITANDVTLITLPSNAQTTTSETIGDAGIHVTSNDTIVVYAHQYSSKRSEAAIILPTDALEKEYYAMSYIGTTDNNGKASPSEFLAVAAYDTTTLTITVADQTKGGQADGASITVIVNQGETYQVQALTANGDLTGSHIVSDKPIALFSGNKWTAVGNCKAMDNLYEQMYPVNTWGKEYIIARTQGRPNDYDIVRIMASEDSTLLYINGAFVDTLNTSEFYQYDDYNEASFVSANKPICVAQFITGSGCYNGNDLGDPAMILANPIGQTIDKVTFYSSPYESIDSSGVNIIASTADTASILYDGLPISNWGYRFTPVPSNSSYSYVYLSTDTGVHQINGGNCGITGIVYGFGYIESYGYSVGASYKNLSLDFEISSCSHDTITFSAQTGETVSSYLWDLGDGNVSTESNPKHVYADKGYYTISLKVYTSTICDQDSIEHSEIVYISWMDSLETSTNDVSCFGLADGVASVQAFGGISPYTYQWDDPLMQSSQTASNLISGNYQITVTDSIGCTFISSVEIGSPSALANNMSNTTIFCGTNSGALTTNVSGGSPFTNGYHYLWNDSLQQTSSGIDSLSSGTYKVEITDSLGCSLSDSIVINVFELPDADAGINQSICIGEAISIGGSPSGPINASFLWSPSKGLDDSLSSNPNTQAISDLTYYLTVVDTNGCIAADSVSIQVYQLPSISLTNDTLICSGDSLSLKTSGGIIYKWNFDSTLSDSTIANPLVFPLHLTTYYVTVTDTNNCSAHDSVAVDPYLPIVAAGNSSWVCEGTPTTLIVSGANQYKWFPSTYLNDSTLANPVSTPLDTITYIVIGIDALGCENTDTVTLTVNRVVPTDAGMDYIICPNEILTIGGSPTAPDGSMYQWSIYNEIDNDTISNPTIWPDSTINIKVQTAYGTLCNGIDSILVQVLPLPVIEAGNDSSLCLGDSIQLKASGATTYSWSPNQQMINYTTATPIVNPSSSLYYFVNGMDSNGCSNLDSVFVTVYSLPPADAGKDQSICLGDSCTLNANGGKIYNWQPKYFLSSDTTSSTISFPDISTMYFVSVQDSNGCSALDSTLVTVNTLAVIDAGEDINTCMNDSIVLNATYNASYRYEWTPSEGLNNPTIFNPSVNIQTNTQYIVTVTDSNNCVNFDSIAVNITSLPISAFSVVSFVPTCEGMMAQFSNESSNATSYLWNFGDGQYSTEEQPQHNFTYNGNGNIQLIAYNSPSCSDTSLVPSTINSISEYISLKIPNMFTPNNDGYNDVFLQNMDPELWNCIDLNIFNRWGQVIYSSEQGPNWDGNTKAAIAAEDDTYLYTIRIVDYELNGTLKLIR